MATTEIKSDKIVNGPSNGYSGGNYQIEIVRTLAPLSMSKQLPRRRGDRTNLRQPLWETMEPQQLNAPGQETLGPISPEIRPGGATSGTWTPRRRRRQLGDDWRKGKSGKAATRELSFN